MDRNDPDRIVCSRVADRTYEPFLTPDCTQETCDLCCAPVWVAPCIQALITKALRRPEIVCVPCWFSGPWREDKVSLAPGQLQEIAKLHPELAMRIAGFFQKPGTN